MGAIIRAEQLRKVFDVPVRDAGLKAAMRSLVHRTSRQVVAVDEVSFEIAPGEVVGFLGPNGAGKTTTLKTLSGLLHPTGGRVEVLGFEPWTRSPDLLRRITLVMGNRNQLVWDLPALDSYELNRAVYRIPRADFVNRRDELIELLDLGDLVNKPVRNLSLGERMKVEIAGCLLHRPAVLFLDEPTLGLDITMQKRIRAFLGEENRRNGSTVLLTSHYMADVQALCKRVLVIHHGRLLFDGDLTTLTERFTSHKVIVVHLGDGHEPGVDLARSMGRYGTVQSVDGDTVTLQVPRNDAAAVTARLLAEQPVADLTIEEPPIDDVIDTVFRTESITAARTPEPQLDAMPEPDPEPQPERST
jgi:ABC-2 type transport system ATP-binding protein